MKTKTNRFSCKKCNSNRMMIAQERISYTMISSMKIVENFPFGSKWLECADCRNKQKYPFKS